VCILIEYRALFAAIADYSRALEIDPNYAIGLNNRYGNDDESHWLIGCVVLM